jgi:hypothetical protein
MDLQEKTYVLDTILMNYYYKATILHVNVIPRERNFFLTKVIEGYYKYFLHRSQPRFIVLTPIFWICKFDILTYTCHFPVFIVYHFKKYSLGCFELVVAAEELFSRVSRPQQFF